MLSGQEREQGQRGASVRPVAADNGRTEGARAEARDRRQQHLDQEVAAGRMGSLEAEFLSLVSDRSAANNPQVRHEAIRAWQAEKGAALKAERDVKRAQEKPQRDAARADATQRRLQHIDEEVAAGRMGVAESGHMKILAAAHASPEARHEAILAWQAEHGSALKAERAAKRERERPQRDAARAEAQQRRLQHIDEEVAAGRMGRLEAEFLGVLQDSSDDPQTRHEAIRAWQTEKGAALKTERAADRGRQSATELRLEP